MGYSTDEVRALYSELRCQTIKAVIQAMEKMARIAQHGGKFTTEHEKLTCAALCRFAPLVLAGHARVMRSKPKLPQSRRRQETPEQMAQLDKLFELQMRDHRDHRGEMFAKLFREKGADKPLYATEEEARAYGRRQFDEQMEEEAMESQRRMRQLEDESW